MERKPFETIFDGLKQAASTWIPTWKDLRNYNRPTAGSFDGDLPNQGKSIDHQTMLDGTPQRASNNFADGLASHLTSPSRPWWKPVIEDQDLMEFEPVKLWLGDVERDMYAVQAGSNIYGTLHTDYGEIGAFATSAMAVLEDREDVIRGRNYTIGEYYLGTDHTGRVNQFAYRYNRTVAQLVGEFGEKKVSQQVLQMYNSNKRQVWVKCFYLITPNRDREYGMIDNQNMPWIALSWEEGSPADTFLDISGFNDFPILASRWGVVGNNVYGNGSAGWESLGDCKMLQKMQRDKLIQVEKVGDPPTQSDGTVEGIVNTLPGGHTRSSALTPDGGLRAAYQIRPDLEALQATILASQKDIRDAYKENLFLLLTQDLRRGDKTARQVIEENAERLTMLGPLVERMYQEKLAPLIRRQFNIMWRAGQIAPPPPELEGHIIQVELISILAQAQKASGTRAIDETLTVAGEMAKTDSSAEDIIDKDAAQRIRADMVGAPAKMMRSKEQVASIRRARQQELDKQAQQAQIERAAVTAKTASETQLGTGSALDAVVGAGQ